MLLPVPKSPHAQRRVACPRHGNVRYITERMLDRRPCGATDRVSEKPISFRRLSIPAMVVFRPTLWIVDRVRAVT